MDLQTRQTPGTAARTRGFAPCRTIVLVGLMGAGKTKIGRRLAARLNLPFFDSDSEIETAAGESIEEIFRYRGEAVFRDGERRVIARLLAQPTHVLATGGGAFMDPATRALITRRGVSVWLRADLDRCDRRQRRGGAGTHHDAGDRRSGRLRAGLAPARCRARLGAPCGD